MSLPRAIIEHNLQSVKARIRSAWERSGRTDGEPALIAVTKSVGVEEARILEALGVTEFADNRPENAAPKVAGLEGAVRWHMIGSVQRRKAATVVQLFSAVDSIDRIEVADALERRCAEQGKSLRVLIEVNVSGEESKHGFAPSALPEAIEAIRGMERLSLEGLMTMAPLDQDSEMARPVFAGLRKLADSFGLKELSMGMSNDFEVAIEEGATQVRIGSALFEKE